MDARTRDAIDHLKASGFEIYEGVPKWADLSIDELANWRVKISAWGTDMRHAQINHAEAIDAELDRRMRQG